MSLKWSKPSDVGALAIWPCHEEASMATWEPGDLSAPEEVTVVQMELA